MFGKKTADVSDELRKKILTMEHQYEMSIQSLKQEKELALKEKEFELKHFKDDEISKLKEKINVSLQENAVLKKENEMLGKITNINADIIDVKDLVSKLISKLPEINLQNLTIHSDGNGSK